jgi:Phage integrase, N-terminal SAM-like domain
MGRFQQGYIYEAFNAFHVRYYLTEIVDAKPKRVQRSHRLCSKDNKYHSRTCKPVRQKCEEFMRGINEQTPGRANERDITVADFWEKTYLPFAKENLRTSTVYGYEQIWNQHLKLHFGELTLKEYRTHMGSVFLTGFAKTLGRHTLQHIRSLCSGIFSHAVNLGVIESNPWHD